VLDLAFNTNLPINLSNSRIAGDGSSTDSRDGGQADNAGIFHPRGLVYDSIGNLYITSESGFVRKVDPNGFITTFAGRLISEGGVLEDQGHADTFLLNKPFGMVIDEDNGFLYVADTNNHRVVRIDLVTRLVETVAGTGSCDNNLNDGQAALSASLCFPTQIGLDDQNNLLIVDSEHQRIRRVNFSQSEIGTFTFVPDNEDLSTLVRNEDEKYQHCLPDHRLYYQWNCRRLQFWNY